MGQCLWEGTARDGHFEGVVAVDAGVLALDNIGSEGAGEAADVGKGEKVRISSHRDGLWWWVLWDLFVRDGGVVCRS